MDLYQRYNSKKGMVTVKKYRDAYKVTIHKNLRIKGLIENKGIKITDINGITYEYDDDPEYTNIEMYVDDLTGEEYYVYDIEKRREEKIEKNPQKLANNISRAKSTIYELALCNDWDYFCTFTLDKEKYDRYDLEKFHKDFTQKIRDLNKKEGYNIKFLLIPEKHKDGAWHMHGLVAGISAEDVLEFTEDRALPKYINDKLQRNEKVCYWKTYQDKFGFCILEEIKNIYKVSAYITKYICKDLDKSIKEINAHLYYCSRGLSRATEITRGFIDMPLLDNIQFNFENDYLKIHWCDEEEYQNLKYFIDIEE